jgi:hypothetical protein
MRSYDVLCHVAVPQSQEVEGSYHAASTVTEEEDFVVSATVRVRSTAGSTRREVMLHLRTWRQDGIETGSSVREKKGRNERKKADAV